MTSFATTLGITLAFLLAAFGWGSAVTRRRNNESGLAEYATQRLVLGLAVIYALCLILAVFHVMTRIPVGLLLIVGMALGALEGECAVGQLKAAADEVQRWNRMDRSLLWTAFVLVAAQIVCGLSPLVFYDSLVYHLAAPAQFLRQGSLAHIPWNVSSDTPMALQLIMGSSLALDDSGAAFKLIVTCFGCLVPVAAALLVKDFGRRASLWAAVFTLCYPEFWVQQALGIIDLAAAAFVLLGVFWLRRDRSVLSGLCLGLALGSRYQTVPVVLVAVLVCAIAARWDSSFRRTILISGLIGFAVLAPWLIRNEMATGNPVFPLLFDRLGGADWSSAQSLVANMDALGPGFGDVPVLQKILAPVGTYLITPSNGLFGLVLLLSGLAVLWRERSPGIREWAIIGLAGVAIWGFVKPAMGPSIIRYNAASLVFLIAVAACILHSRQWICTILCVGSLAMALPHVNSIVPLVRTLTDESARTSYFRSQNASWAAMAFLNRELSSTGNKVLFIGETRSFWSRIPVVAAGPFNGPQLKAAFQGPSAGWSSRLKGLGVTHLFVSQPEWKRLNQRYGYFRLTEGETRQLGDWLARQQVVFDDGAGNLVFALTGGVDVGS